MGGLGLKAKTPTLLYLVGGGSLKAMIPAPPTTKIKVKIPSKLLFFKETKKRLTIGRVMTTKVQRFDGGHLVSHYVDYFESNFPW